MIPLLIAIFGAGRQLLWVQGKSITLNLLEANRRLGNLKHSRALDRHNHRLLSSQTSTGTANGS